MICSASFENILKQLNCVSLSGYTTIRVKKRHRTASQGVPSKILPLFDVGDIELCSNCGTTFKRQRKDDSTYILTTYDMVVNIRSGFYEEEYE
jgi:hypothetical protein